MINVLNSAEDITYQKRRKIFSLISLAVLIAVFTMATVLLWKPLAGTFQKPEQFRAWVDSNGLLGRLAFIGIAMLQVIFAVIPGEPIELGAGYAFGAVEGTALCLLADVVATAMIVLFTKRFGIKLVEVFLSREKISSLKFLHNRRKLNLLIFLLFELSLLVHFRRFGVGGHQIEIRRA